MAARSEACRSAPAAAGGEDPQPLVEARFQAVESERREPGRGQLDGQRDAVQRPAQLRDPPRVRRHAIARRGRDPGGEQVNGIPAAADHREPRHDVHPLVREEKAGTARRQHGELRAAGDDPLDAGPDAVDDVLAVVQDEQSVPPGERGDQGELDGRGPLLGDADRLGDRRGHRARVGHADQVGEPHAVAALGGRLGRDAQRQPGLAHAARTGGGHHAVVGESRGQSRPLGDATDERGDRHRQPAPAGPDRTGAGTPRRAGPGCAGRAAAACAASPTRGSRRCVAR